MKNTLTTFVSIIACFMGFFTFLSLAVKPSGASGFGFFFLFFTSILVIIIGLNAWPFGKQGWEQKTFSISVTVTGIGLLFLLPLLPFLHLGK